MGIFTSTKIKTITRPLTGSWRKRESMTSSINDIQIGRQYGYWVVLNVVDGWTQSDMITGAVVKKGKKKAGVFVEGWNKIKWKYPHELTLCE